MPVVKIGNANSALARRLTEHGLLPPKTVGFSISVPGRRSMVRITAEYLVSPADLERALDLHHGIERGEEPESCAASPSTVARLSGD